MEDGGWRGGLVYLQCSIFNLRLRGLLSHRNNDRADQCSGEQKSNHFQRQNKLRHQRVANLFDGGFGLRWEFAQNI